MNIPISFRGQQQPQQQGYQQQREQQYQQGFPQREQGFQQPSQQGFQQREQGFQSREQGKQQGYEPQQGYQQQTGGEQQPSVWQSIKEAVTGGGTSGAGISGMAGTRGGYSMESQGQVGSGEFKTKELQSNNVSAADLTNLHMLLLLSGECYVKEHVLLSLCQDKSGVIKQWHKNVTIRNLDRLSGLAKSWGLTLPFRKSLEQREHEIKSRLQNVGQVLTDGECLKEIKLGACLLEQHFAQAYFLSHNNEFLNLAKELCGNVCDNVLNVKHALTQTEDFYPVPIVKSVVAKEGILERR